MKANNNYKQIKKSNKVQLPLVIGSFDIIHKGHWNLLSQVINKDFNVLIIINSPKAKTYFNTLEQRLNNLSVFSPTNIYVLDIKNKNYTHVEFIKKVLKYINPSEIIVGKNFKFGKNAVGNNKYLSKFYKVKETDIDNNSTKIIKDLYLKNNVREANKKIILPILYEGKVIKGNQFGRTYGFPTLNQVFKDKNLVTPRNGIYAAEVYINNNIYPAATYINKTKAKTLIESYAINKKLPFNMYGKVIKTRLLDYIKPTKKIATGDHKKYVSSMVKLVKKYFNI